MKKLLLITTIVSLAFTACKKNNSGATGSVSSPTTNTPAKYYGKLIAAEGTVDSASASYQQVVSIATFYKYPDSAITDAGTVNCAGTQLYQLFGLTSSYIYFGGGTFSSTKIPWTVSGSPTVTAFNYTCTRTLPSEPSPTSSMTVNRSAGYTLTCTGTNADSVEFKIDDGNFSVVKRLKGSATSCSFSATELNTLSAGINKDSYIGVNGINFETATINGKAYMFQSARTHQKYKITIL